MADKLGRKPIILVADLLFIVGALWQATTASVAGMIVGRTIVGFAVGGASLVVPLYISELSPSAFRGKLVTLSVLFITIGQVISYLIGYALSMRSGGWRWMVGLGAIPALLQFGLMIMLPESPRWLVRAGSVSEARKILQNVYAAGKDAMVEEVLRAIKSEVSDEEATSDDISTAMTGNKVQKWSTRIRKRTAELLHIGANRRALTIACLLQGLQQLCGFVRQLLSLSLYSALEHGADHVYIELIDVFLRHHIFPPRIHLPNSNLALDRTHKFHLYPHRPPHHRHRRSPKAPTPLNSSNGRRPAHLFDRIRIPRPSELGRAAIPLLRRRTRSSQSLANRRPNSHGHLRLRLRHRSWKHSVAAKRAVPALRTLAWLGVGDRDELGV